MKIVGIIPSRYASSRLPGKPLIDIAGKPMIQWVYERASKASCLSEVVVATDDQRIYDAVTAFGGQAEMTSPDHNNGTERCGEIADEMGADYFINIQGDEPLVYPDHIDAIAKTIKDNNTIKCALGYTEYSKKNSFSDIKAVLDINSNIIYCSRTDLPSDAYVTVDKMKKLCFIVAFQKPFLAKYASWSPTPLEKIEFNEYLRILEYGEKIRAVQIDGAKISVDTKEDLIKVRKLMEEDKLMLNYLSSQ